jgi:DNA-binding transcriptional ArsR family regulator
MIEIGLDPTELEKKHPRGYWSADPHGRVVERIRHIAAEEGVSALSARAVYLKHQDLHDAALRYFSGGWEEAITKAGFDYKSIRKQREPYTKPELLETLRRLHDEGLSLAWSSIRNYDPNLAAATVSRFGKYERAIGELGLDYSEVRKDWDTEARKGGLFEKYLVEMFEAIGCNVKYQKRFRFETETCVPDFFETSTKLWIDAKLDPTTLETGSSIEKYLRHTDSVEIIYLTDGRPPTVRDWMKGRVTFIPVREYYPRLLELEKKELILRFEQLREARLSKEDVGKLDKQAIEDLIGRLELPLTETTIVDELKELQSEGQKIDLRHLPAKLKRAAVEIFGGTREMYEAAGIESVHFYIRPRYTKRQLATIVKDRYANGLSITHHALMKDHPGIAIAIGRLYGSSRELYKAAGIPMTGHVDRRQKDYWKNGENIKAELKKRYLDGQDMKRQVVCKDSPVLVSSAAAAFGGYYEALDAAGIDSSNYRSEAPKGYWTRPQIINEIKKLEAVHEDLSAAHCLRNHRKLYQAGKQEFRGWSKAVNAAGFDYRNYSRLNKQVNLHRVRELRNAGHSIQDIADRLGVGKSTISRRLSSRPP